MGRVRLGQEPYSQRLCPPSPSFHITSMAERRYSETEVGEIFKRASEAQQQGGRVPLASGEGMTLGALQEIGRDVGLPPELVERAAREIDRTGEPSTRRFLGLPVG